MSLFIDKPFTSHAGLNLMWKIECDALTDEDIKTLVSVIIHNISFSTVIGIPRGGLRLANALKPYEGEGGTLIVDDVYTTGKSMEEAKAKTDGLVRGVVIFARAEPPAWIDAIFTLGLGS